MNSWIIKEKIDTVVQVVHSRSSYSTDSVVQCSSTCCKAVLPDWRSLSRGFWGRGRGGLQGNPSAILSVSGMEVSGSRGVGGAPRGAGVSASCLPDPLIPASPWSRSSDGVTTPAVATTGDTVSWHLCGDTYRRSRFSPQYRLQGWDTDTDFTSSFLHFQQSIFNTWQQDGHFIKPLQHFLN